MVKKIECEGGVANLASSRTASLKKSSLRDSKDNPVVARVGVPINKDVALEGSDCVIKELLEEAPDQEDRSLPCPKCRRTVNYRSKKIKDD